MKRDVVKRRSVAAAVIGLGLLAGWLLSSCAVLRPFTTEALGAARTKATLLEAGDMAVPEGDRATPGDPGAATGIVGDLIRSWAEGPLPNWQEEGKVTAPRVLLAKLAVGIDLGEVNSYVQAAEPWANIGSTWELRENGDYDFSLPGLTAILYLYGDDEERLYPETRRHLLEELLTEDGGFFRTTVPGSMGLVTETENHILMTEGSAYLKNQWLADRGDDSRRYDNRANGMEEKLLTFLEEMELAGSYEFNSHPYAGYTVMALTTLEAFAHEPVAGAARRVLDRMNYQYALGSLGLRRYAPFRRQPRRADRTDLRDHPHTAMMQVWLAQALEEARPGAAEVIDMNDHHAVYAALMPYRLPGDVVATATQAVRGHSVRIGRGPGASPELYTAGADGPVSEAATGYLLSAGGTGRPEGSLIVARPITLFLEDRLLSTAEADATDVSGLFRLGGAGDYHEWNNTGVIPDFAVGRPPLEVPAAYRDRVLAEDGVWLVYQGPGELLIAGADTGNSAALYISTVTRAGGEDATPAAAAAELRAALETGSPGPALDAGSVTLPDGRTVDFDLAANADTWVIEEVDGEPRARDLTGWPRLQSLP